jgi:mRNA interferase MazF
MYKQGEIVLIPVPFTDLSASKKRPVLIVSNDRYNTERPDMIVVAITSNLSQTGIAIGNDDMVSGQLPKPSIIRSDKIYTLNQDIVVKLIGFVSKAIQNSVKQEISELIDFSFCAS